MIRLIEEFKKGIANHFLKLWGLKFLSLYLQEYIFLCFDALKDIHATKTNPKNLKAQFFCSVIINVYDFSLYSFPCLCALKKMANSLSFPYNCSFPFKCISN